MFALFEQNVSDSGSVHSTQEHGSIGATNPAFYPIPCLLSDASG